MMAANVELVVTWFHIELAEHSKSESLCLGFVGGFGANHVSIPRMFLWSKVFEGSVSTVTHIFPIADTLASLLFFLWWTWRMEIGSRLSLCWGGGVGWISRAVGRGVSLPSLGWHCCWVFHLQVAWCEL